MGFSEENGYTPLTIDALKQVIIEGINAQFGTSYTIETFTGTNFDKIFYAQLQHIQELEIKMSEVFLKAEDYFKTTNETIIEPKTTNNGLITIFEQAGYIASIKQPSEMESGQAFICVDVDDEADDYAEKRLEICNIIKDYIVAGVISLGTEEETIVLTNGQSFDFKFGLPNRLETSLKLTLTTSRNNQEAIDDTDTIKNKLLSNIQAKYRLGRDFEPETYFTSLDAPYAGNILLEYSFNDGGTWLSEVYGSEYDDLIEVALDRAEIVQE